MIKVFKSNSNATKFYRGSYFGICECEEGIACPLDC